ncbi:hypothetical protein B0H10DRAFT_1940334 [Mycena sp. CBHHK59/15]|nr:hypothetical protein B0H10DRAFT_1940334 [Mycena sp. CBHHK59/15]
MKRQSEKEERKAKASYRTSSSNSAPSSSSHRIHPSLSVTSAGTASGDATPTRSNTPIGRPTTPTNPDRIQAPHPHRRHVRNESLAQITENMAGLNTSITPLPGLLSGPCPGVAVPWSPGSIWGTYPYALHESHDPGWQPIRFDSKENTIYLRGNRLHRKNSNYKHIMVLLSQNELSGLRRTLETSLNRGASAQMILAVLLRALAGLYSPRGGFNKRELDISFLVKSIGGPRLLYALQKSYGLASVSTVQRNQPIPRLLSSIGPPSQNEINQNISSFFNAAIKPPPSHPDCCSLPGNIVMFDGVAIEPKCRYCPYRDVITGLCREHVNRVNPKVDSLKSVEDIQKKLDADPKSEDKVCFGTDATVVAVAPYARDDYYTAVPIVVSPSDKTEKAPELADWVCTVLGCWKTNPEGEALHGPIWAIGSDGDHTYRLAKFIVCMTTALDPASDLYKTLSRLLGLNLRTSPDGVVATSDPKHIAKRFATLLRNLLGLMIFDSIIKPTDIIDHLSMLENMTREKATQLLDPADKQNVPKAIALVQQLANLKNLEIPLNPVAAKQRKTINFFAEVLGSFVFPFITVSMSLSEQVRSLSKYAHLTATLFIKHGTACLTGPLYADSQAVVKNIVFTIARMQILDPNLCLYILLEGTDRLEVVFCDTRTLDHARNFDIEQLAQKLSLGALINTTFQRNPDIDRAHRRLKLDGALGIDHVNPKSWMGNARVGDVNLAKEWKAGENDAIDLLIQYFGPSACVNFAEIFSKENCDCLRPAGEYVGTSWTEDDERSEQEHGVPLGPASIPEDMDNNSIPGAVTEQDIEGGLRDDDEYDDPPVGLDLDDFFPETPEGLDQDQPPIAFSKFLIADDGGHKKASMRTLQVRGVALEDLRQKKLDIDYDPLDESGDNLKAGDLVATLVRAGTYICLAVLSIKGFRLGPEKSLQASMEMTVLEDHGSEAKLVCQIMEMSHESNGWEWTGKYLRLNTSDKDARATHAQFLLEVPGVFIVPLAPTISQQESGVTWCLKVKALQEVQEFSWQMLDPDSEQILENIQMLPEIVNPASLPYHDSSVIQSPVIYVEHIANSVLCEIMLVTTYCWPFEGKMIQSHAQSKNLVLIHVDSVDVKAVTPS